MNVTTVKQVESPGFVDELIEDGNIIASSLRNMDKRWDISTKIHLRVQLDATAGTLKRGPRRKRQTQLNRGRIKGVDGIVEVHSKRFVCVERSRDSD